MFWKQNWINVWNCFCNFSFDFIDYVRTIYLNINEFNETTENLHNIHNSRNKMNRIPNWWFKKCKNEGIKGSKRRSIIIFTWLNLITMKGTKSNKNVMSLKEENNKEKKEKESFCGLIKKMIEPFALFFNSGWMKMFDIKYNIIFCVFYKRFTFI